MSDIATLQEAAKILNRHGLGNAAELCTRLIGRLAVDEVLGGATEPEPAPGKRLTRITP